MVIISASLIALLVIWFAIAIKNTTVVRKANVKEVEVANEEVKKGSLFSFKMISCYILYFTTCYTYYMIVTWLPKFLESERGIAGSMIGLIVSMISVTAVPGALYFAHMSDKKRDKKSLIIIGLEVVTFVLVAFAMKAPNATVLAIILLAYGFLGKMAVDPVLISFISDNANKKDLATTLGTFNFFGMSSSIIAPAFTGFIIDKTGSGELGFYIGAGLLLVGTIIFIFANNKNLVKKEVSNI